MLLPTQDNKNSKNKNIHQCPEWDFNSEPSTGAKDRDMP
jgi:hypothetical protein